MVSSSPSSASSSRSAPPTTTSSRTRCARASSRSSGGAGSPTIRMPRTSCSCSTGRTARPHPTARTPRTTRTPSTTSCYRSCRLLDDGPEKQKVIDQMVAIVRRTRRGPGATSRMSSGAFQQWVHNGKPSIMVRDMAQYYRIDPALRARKLAEWNPPRLWPLALLAALALLRRRRAGAAIRRARARDAPRRGRTTPARRRDAAARCADRMLELHRPPSRLRRADPARGQPGHLLPVLHRQHARRHGAAEHRRQARHAASRSRSGRPSAATTSRSTGTTRSEGSEQAHRHDLLGALGVAVRARLRPRRRRERAATSATRSARACGVSLQLARAAVHPAGDREHRRSRCCWCCSGTRASTSGASCCAC